MFVFNSVKFIFKVTQKLFLLQQMNVKTAFKRQSHCTVKVKRPSEVTIRKRLK